MNQREWHCIAMLMCS